MHEITNEIRKWNGKKPYSCGLWENADKVIREWLEKKAGEIENSLGLVEKSRVWDILGVKKYSRTIEFIHITELQPLIDAWEEYCDTIACHRTEHKLFSVVKSIVEGWEK